MHSLRFPSADHSVVSSAGIAFIGCSFFCTWLTCNHVELEFRTRCIQADTVDMLDAMCPDRAALRLVIVDERFVDDLLAEPARFRAASPSAMIALGYRNVAAARAHFARNREAGGAPIGYVAMTHSLEVMMSSLRLLFHGEYFVPHSVLGDRDAATTPCASMRRADTGAKRVGDIAEKFARLTCREREILGHVSGGESNKQIARRLGITEHTVKLHMHNLFSKFGVTNRTAAAKLYLMAKADDAAR